MRFTGYLGWPNICWFLDQQLLLLNEIILTETFIRDKIIDWTQI